MCDRSKEIHDLWAEHYEKVDEVNALRSALGEKIRDLNEANLKLNENKAEISRLKKSLVAYKARIADLEKERGTISELMLNLSLENANFKKEVSELTTFFKSLFGEALADSYRHLVTNNDSDGLNNNVN